MVRAAYKSSAWLCFGKSQTLPTLQTELSGCWEAWVSQQEPSTSSRAEKNLALIFRKIAENCEYFSCLFCSAFWFCHFASLFHPSFPSSRLRVADNGWGRQGSKKEKKILALAFRAKNQSALSMCTYMSDTSYCSYLDFPPALYNIWGKRMFQTSKLNAKVVLTAQSSVNIHAKLWSPLLPSLACKPGCFLGGKHQQEIQERTPKAIFSPFSFRVFLIY